MNSPIPDAPTDYKASVDTVRQADMQSETGDAIIDKLTDLQEAMTPQKG